MRGATVVTAFGRIVRAVSIHAPHAGRDHSFPAAAPPHGCFNPRAPCGARLAFSIGYFPFPVFQSTRPMRGATAGALIGPWQTAFQSTRPMRGATFHLVQVGACGLFQSTRPMRGATSCLSTVFRYTWFQSTRPMRGATFLQRVLTVSEQFQSTRPMRGATFEFAGYDLSKVFQSTRPMRGATLPPHSVSTLTIVSIHAPHTGRDRRRRSHLLPKGSFNPRAPCGARRFTSCGLARVACFNPRAPCGARLVAG